MKESPGKTVWLIIRIAISAALVIALARMFDLSKMPALFRNVNSRYVVLALILILVSVMVSARKWSVLIQGQNISIGYVELFAAYLAGHFFNNFLPSSIGGDAARVICIGKKRGLIPELTASVIAERLLAMTSLSVVGLGGAIFSQHKNYLALIILSSVFVFSLFLNLVIINGWIPAAVKNGKGKISRTIRDASASVSQLRNRPGLIARCFIGSAAFQIVVAAVMLTVLHAFGISSVPFVDMLFITSASSVLAMIPAGINGYGLREGSYAMLLAPYGIGADAAVSASLLFAFLVSAFSISGFFSWLVLSRTNTFPVKKEQYAEES